MSWMLEETAHAYVVSEKTKNGNQPIFQVFKQDDDQATRRTLDLLMLSPHMLKAIELASAVVPDEAEMTRRQIGYVLGQLTRGTDDA